MIRAEYRFVGRIAPLAALIALATGGRPSFAQEQSAQADQQKAAEFLQTAVESLTIEADDADPKRLALRKSPLFKYSDPARGYSAAGVWRLGETGRPQALVSLEYWLRGETDEPRLMYELVSLTDARLTVSSTRAKLPSEGMAPQFAALTVAEKPAASEKQRLLQLRNLARRFTLSEKHMGDFAALRLLPQPIDRYEDTERGIVDGGVFVFVYGTNPETALLLECDKSGWRYALSRMTWAEVVVEFDGTEVARFDQLTSFPASGGYRSAGHVIESRPNP
jgi:hypothetical protein